MRYFANRPLRRFEGAAYVLQVDEQVLTATALPTQHGRDFVPVDLGKLRFDKSGDFELRLVMQDGARAIQGAEKDKTQFQGIQRAGSGAATDFRF